MTSWSFVLKATGRDPVLREGPWNSLSLLLLFEAVVLAHLSDFAERRMERTKAPRAPAISSEAPEEIPAEPRAPARAEVA
jgi:hypothetical protein